MSTVVCPHCHTNVPHGAKVCTGRQAEVEYGAPAGALLVAIIASGFFGLKAGTATYPVVGWIVFGVLTAGSLYACYRIFKNRINFKRIYKTR